MSSKQIESNKQIKALRAQINAADAAGNEAKARELQSKLHALFVAETDAFTNSAAGVAHIDYLMGQP